MILPHVCSQKAEYFRGMEWIAHRIVCLCIRLFDLNTITICRRDYRACHIHTHCTSEDKDASCLAGFPSLVRMWTTVTLQSGGAAGMCADYRDCARNNTARGKGKKLDAPVLFIKMSVADLFTVIKISALGLQLLHHVPEYLQTWSTSDFRKKSV